MNIKELRTSCSMTQAEFSKALKIPRRTIEDWERGLRKPPEYLISLIEFYIKNGGINHESNNKKN